MLDKDRYVPVQLLQEVIKTIGYPDPNGSRVLMYYSRMFRQGVMYNLVVLYDKTTNKFGILNMQEKLWVGF